ncbi:MAG: hypothetical protein EPN98_07875 [Phenylobacterium sp.]|uniref:hypothetical protein n=1 Tax=Phenylobacterium sp. TaxID=1871053 RepID=UPI0011FA06A2|nr:hypothetical protein [Phenylobacterium sp.]TAL34965.1 MAG: hypothetical protein EPN98_07875 [Phenylobacterium sp.]
MDSPENPENNRANDRVVYPVRVDYEIRLGGRTIAFETIFRVTVGSGPGDGTIDLDETSRISVEDLQRPFPLASQISKFDENASALMITGTSKHGMRDRVAISPTIAAT